MIFIILFQVIAPPYAYALTGGPSQPEVQSFEPVGTSEMVDPFSGDFNYNIPLMDIDGYPINIAYNGGITMDQEASWVGLGWNINPGVINRGMRGLPDDFNGDEVIKELNMKPNRTYGLNTGFGIELFGLDKLKLGINYSIGVRYNNYNGMAIEQGLNLALSTNSGGKSSGTASLGITSSSDDGLSLNPSISFSSTVAKNTKTGTSAGLSASVGSSFNSRAGLKALTIGLSGRVSTSDPNKAANKSRYGYLGNEGDTQNSASLASSSFDFGMPTFTPQGGPSMQNFSITGNFKLGFELYGLHPNFTVGGYYSAQKLTQKVFSNPAYGYLHADEGTKYDNALLDFNREKDGPFTPNTPALPLTNFTYDIYSVSGQGVGGSYRPFRGDLGHVFDARTGTTSDGISTGFEIGIGNLTHFGSDFALTDVNTQTGRWSDDNPAASRLTHHISTGDPLYENYYFKEANEKSVDADSSFFYKVGKHRPKSVLLNQLSKFHTVGDHYYAEGQQDIAANNYRKKRERRNQSLSMISRDEMAGYGLEVRPKLYTPGPGQTIDHHIAEITTLRTDGARYVYGIAAYNTRQEEVTFAVGTTLNNDPGRAPTASSGLVTYAPGDNSNDNLLGIDNYYSNTIMPPYAHSYLLTAILSPDYIDSENYNATTRGPSPGDIGNYTRFEYDTVISNYRWRVPVGDKQATFNEGLKSDHKDDKANYIYGEKELYYLTKIETKNYVAIFTLEPRKDGYGVTNNDGKRAANKPMRLLKKISLYSKPDYDKNPAQAVPIKEVHFQYNYSLCRHVPNNINFGTGSVDDGKLTLTGISFSYQHSNKARLSPYKFAYSGSNPDYDLKAYDRWGNYKPSPNAILSATDPNIPTAEFPYVEQNKSTADQYAQAWSLTEVNLPSGGKINVEYESDDYAYVQNKRAGQMFKVVDILPVAGNFSTNTFTVGATDGPGTTVDLNHPAGTMLIVKLQDPLTGPNRHDLFRARYLDGIDNLYFRFLMDIMGGRYEYVSGYIKPNSLNRAACQVDFSGQYACIPLLNTNTKDNNNGSSISPITKAAIQFGRLNMSRVVWNSAALDGAIGDNESFGLGVLQAIVNADFTKNIVEAIEGPNEALYNKGVGIKMVRGKSWVRLNNPNGKKLGGGCRVKKIAISDEWSGMSNSAEPSFIYGQVYDYTLEDGTSSGVASYEPQLGGDENPWKIPIFVEEEKMLAPDDEHYVEEPFGESFFPSPSVGYSRVTVKNLQWNNVARHATGKVVHEFYTAKDFPTITERTSLTAKQEKTSPFSIASLLKIDVKDYMTASQGYVIELNDMNGKPFRQSVYQEGQTTPITSVEYHYKSKPYLNGASRLDNEATVVYNDGTVAANNIGVFFDFVSDMREHKTTTVSGSINANVDGFLVGPYTLYIPIILPSFTQEITQFRSAVITKVIQRFGILEETVAKDLGSVVSTKNLAYDAETGNVLLTQTTTDFNDQVYSLTYPAYWYYHGMGPAYRNIGFKKTGVTFSTTGIANITNAPAYFAEGDELALSNGTVGWVLDVNLASIRVVDRNGGNVTGTLDVKILRSGQRNQQEVSMATITTLSNPLTNFKSNIYDNVLQAQAMEFTNNWRTFCDCFQGAASGSTSNPYVLGTKGMYKNKKSYVHLSGRSQSNYDNNTNIRKDGVFLSYTPFYKLTAGRWDIDRSNWTYTSEVTEFSPFGAELENKDALGRYSAAIYGYNQTFPTAVAANSKYQQIAFDNFEDYAFSLCADNHFKFRNNTSNLVDTQSHTGRNSIRVTNGTPVNMTKQIHLCEKTDACNLQLLPKQTANIICYTVAGGTDPYSFDWTVTGCDLSILINDAGDGICVTKPVAGSCQLIITVTDKNKCKKIFAPITL
ncbi:MAG TPA: hypothetical protein PLR01_05865 [Bacteroidales bacterium]|nr:hypothetical protein [Bacteroidales bacterium]